MFKTICVLLAVASNIAAESSTSLESQVVSATTYVQSDSTSDVWTDNWEKSFPIHTSCNQTKFNQLSAGLDEAMQIAAHARDHTLKYGNNSEIFRKYFGSGLPATVAGVFDSVVNAEKSGMLFRCDDIDGNCKFDGWAGHWRGENGTDETVICDLSFTTRRRLSQLCSQGWTVANSKDNIFWATDLLHRFWHTTVLGHGIVGHYADGYKDSLELASKNSSYAVINSVSLRLFALEVYAYDITVPGVGCSGDSGSSSVVKSSSTTPVAATPTSTDDHDDHAHASDDHDHSHTSDDHDHAHSTGGTECHTHADGVVHCV
ncbi:uncharacterized protein KQ657_000757 [Scheffersomyces spartinae]|uniref:Putative peptidase domain-containing protein n=1 Tax=Scheffersomyces spartinae TaxID=45513 RepID=A0A9P7V8P9_9ASCO|nr:uncharacterized protein KQ657_000757 [Scheffersomyces spartinae]KAG7193341.1 hypothetical protein KQ657_000757 [Scheffersomyces spartinae]